MSNKLPSEIDVRIGGTIRRFREARGMTQAALADGIGVTFQQVQKYERGVNRVAAASMLRAAETLGCSVADLFDEPDPSGATVSERALLRVWAKLKPREQEAALAMLAEFAKR